jgi:hypothetical protein
MVQYFARFVGGRSVGIGELDTDFAVLVSVFLAVVVCVCGGACLGQCVAVSFVRLVVLMAVTVPCCPIL